MMRPLGFVCPCNTGRIYTRSAVRYMELVCSVGILVRNHKRYFNFQLYVGERSRYTCVTWTASHQRARTTHTAFRASRWLEHRLHRYGSTLVLVTVATSDRRRLAVRMQPLVAALAVMSSQPRTDMRLTPSLGSTLNAHHMHIIRECTTKLT
jgi:hypothetical protein